jgi:preprotein translocase subunit YajC
MFINSVFAEEIAQPTFNNVLGSVVPLVIFITIFYLLLIRPQQKKQKEHEEEVKNLKINDKIITSSGIFGRIKKIKEKTLIIEIAANIEIEIINDNVSLVNE